MRRKPLRIQKAFDEYTFKGGHAGFIIVYKNGKRMKLISKALTFNKRKR
jgi:hypothetical protein